MRRYLFEGVEEPISFYPKFNPRPRCKTEEPVLIDCLEPGEVEITDCRKKSKVSKVNTSIFFTELYRVMFGGLAFTGHLKHFVNDDEENSPKLFKPDVIDKSRRIGVYTEVKANSTRSGQPFTTQAQLGRYIGRAMKDFLERGELSYFNYAFFRYGNRNLNGLHKFSNPKLKETLSSNVRDLLVVPQNLLFLLLALPETKSYELNQSNSPNGHGSSSVGRWSISGGSLTTLHEKGGLDELVSKVAGPYDEQLLGLLHLDDLKYRHFDAPMNLWCDGKYQVYNGTNTNRGDAPFGVTVYGMTEKNFGLWIRHFAAYHTKFLGRFGLRDVYAEEKEAAREVPF